MSKLIKSIIIIVCLLFTISILYSCLNEILVFNGFGDKEQVINAVKDNIEDLNLLTKEMYDKYNDPNKKLYTLYIENGLFKHKYSYSYRTILSKRLFKTFRIDYVTVNYDSNYRKNSVEYAVKNAIGDTCGFYYSFDNDKNYYSFDNEIMERIKEEGRYLEFGNKTVLFDTKHGWYTEKIFDNWFYFEEDFDYLNFIKYIYDDITNIKLSNKYYQEHKQFFDKYNPHNLATKSNILVN